MSIGRDQCESKNETALICATGQNPTGMVVGFVCETAGGIVFASKTVSVLVLDDDD